MGNVEIARFLLNRTAVYSATNHQISSVRISPAGEGCASDMFAIAHVVDRERSLVLVRGLRYEDELVREEGEWRIQRRTHTPQWQFEAAAVPPAIPVRPGS